jgi:hypothetical protein
VWTQDVTYHGEGWGGIEDEFAIAKQPGDDSISDDFIGVDPCDGLKSMNPYEEELQRFFDQGDLKIGGTI